MKTGVKGRYIVNAKTLILGSVPTCYITMKVPTCVVGHCYFSEGA